MSKILTADEVKRHNSSRSVWMVIRNSVYDVTAFLEEHPGGTEPLLEAAGQDATIAFEDVGHSQDAIKMLAKYKIGALAPGQGCCKMKARIWRPSSKYHRDCAPCDINSQKSSIRSGYKTPVTPLIERRVRSICVPREPRRPRSPRRPRPPPESYSKLKWGLLALGLAIIIGIAYKRYAS